MSRQPQGSSRRCRAHPDFSDRSELFKARPTCQRNRVQKSTLGTIPKLGIHLRLCSGHHPCRAGQAAPGYAAGHGRQGQEAAGFRRVMHQTGGASSAPSVSAHSVCRNRLGDNRRVASESRHNKILQRSWKISGDLAALRPTTPTPGRAGGGAAATAGGRGGRGGF